MAECAHCLALQAEVARWQLAWNQAIDRAEAAEAEVARLTQEQERVDNGNIYVFCDVVDRKQGGCLRGAGHNGDHVWSNPLCPVVLPDPPATLASLPQEKK
jgi:hypothetical protein